MTRFHLLCKKSYFAHGVESLGSSIMRIKTVLRDSEILNMEPGSKERVLATAKKNLDRFVNLGSLMRVMGLGTDGRIEMLQVLASTNLHIWLANEGDQDIVFLSLSMSLGNEDSLGYRWQ